MGMFEEGIEKNGKTYFGSWSVSKKGDVRDEIGSTFIDHFRLTEDDWILHLAEKGNVDFNEFIRAYFFAHKMAGLSKLNERTYY